MGWRDVLRSAWFGRADRSGANINAQPSVVGRGSQTVAGQNMSPNPPGASGITVPNPNYPQAGTVSNTWWNYTRSYLNFYLNPDKIGIPVYEQMLDSDPSVYAAIQFVAMAVVAKWGEYVHDDPKIEEFVNENLANLRTPWVQVMCDILTALWAGHSCTEIVSDYEADEDPSKFGKSRFQQFQTLPPSTVSYDLHLSGPFKNNLRAAHQYRWGAFEAYLPANKIIVYTHESRFGNLYGNSRMKTAYPYWYMKQEMLGNWAVCLERYGAPHSLALVESPDEDVTDPDTGQKVKNLNYVLGQLKKLASNGSAAFGPGVTASIEHAKQAVGNDFQGFADYTDRMIMRSALVPSLVGDHGSHGSNALGRSHYDLFVLMLDKTALECTEAVNVQAIMPLIVDNFGPSKKGFFNVTEFKSEDEKTLSEAFLALVTAGIIKTSDAEQLNFMLERLGMSPKTQLQIDADAKHAQELGEQVVPATKAPSDGGGQSGGGSGGGGGSSFSRNPASMPGKRAARQEMKKRLDFKTLLNLQREQRKKCGN